MGVIVVMVAGLLLYLLKRLLAWLLSKDPLDHPPPPTLTIWLLNLLKGLLTLPDLDNEVVQFCCRSLCAEEVSEQEQFANIGG